MIAAPRCHTFPGWTQNEPPSIALVQLALPRACRKVGEVGRDGGALRLATSRTTG